MTDAAAALTEGEAIVRRALAELRPWRPPEVQISLKPRPAGARRGGFLINVVEDHGDPRAAMLAKLKTLAGYLADGRWIAAACGLIELRELHRAAAPTLPARERTWRGFLTEHRAIGWEQAEALMGRMRQGGVWTCGHCGTSIKAPCGCQAGHRSSTAPDKKATAMERALAAIRANPDRSNRLIAKSIGVGEWTVRQARKHHALDHAPRRRGGRKT